VFSGMNFLNTPKNTTKVKPKQNSIRSLQNMASPRKKNEQNKDIKKGIRIKFNGKRPIGSPRAKWSSQVLEESKTRSKSWQGIKKRRIV
jgi:hypothetical protein